MIRVLVAACLLVVALACLLAAGVLLLDHYRPFVPYHDALDQDQIRSLFWRMLLQLGLLLALLVAAAGSALWLLAGAGRAADDRTHP